MSRDPNNTSRWVATRRNEDKDIEYLVSHTTWSPDKRFAKIFVCSFIMGSLLYYQFFYFEDYFYKRDLIKVLYLFFIVGNSIFVYFIMSVLFKAFSIKDFKLKNYR